MQRMRGLTLIELVVTMVVLAIVIGIALPSFTQMVRDNRSVALADDLLGAVNYARAEAVKTSSAVSLCASANGTACVGTDWSLGWIVFTDDAASVTAPAPVVATVLRHWQVPNADAAIAVTQNTNNTGFIRFTGIGTLARTGNAEITSKIEGCTGASARTITINGGGVARAQNADC